MLEFLDMSHSSYRSFRFFNDDQYHFVFIITVNRNEFTSKRTTENIPTAPLYSETTQSEETTLGMPSTSTNKPRIPVSHLTTAQLTILILSVALCVCVLTLIAVICVTCRFQLLERCAWCVGCCCALCGRSSRRSLVLRNDGAHEDIGSVRWSRIPDESEATAATEAAAAEEVPLTTFLPNPVPPTSSCESVHSPVPPPRPIPTVEVVDVEDVEVDLNEETTDL